MISSKKRSQLVTAGKALAVFFVLGVCACGGSRRLSQSEEDKELVWPLPPDPPRIRYLKSIHSEMDVGRKRSLAQRIYEGIFGRSPLRSLKKPLSVHIDQSGRVLVVDTGWRKVLIFDFANRRLDILGKSGKGRLLNPLGVTTDKNGRIYVSDAGGYRIMIYNADGSFVNAFGGKDALLHPAGIAVNPELGRIYVVDTWAHQIKAFKESGELDFVIGKTGEPQDHHEIAEGTLDQVWNRGKGEGEFRFPTHLALDAEGNLYVVDTMNFRVQIFSAEGKFLRAFGEVGRMPGNLYRPKGIGLDGDGHVYVSDASFSNVQIFNQVGDLLLNFGTFGSGLSDLRLPAGLYVDQMDQIYVVDQSNNRVQVYQYLRSEPEKETEKQIITHKEGR
jgi:DNA-binding beta-propeller fold protein YncE